MAVTSAADGRDERMQPPSIDLGRDLCAQFLESMPVTGVSIALSGAHGLSTIGTTDATSARLDELQFELGEGPRVEALRTGRPVIVPSLAIAENPLWPIFRGYAHELGVGALFAFPIRLGAITIGSVDAYRNEPGTLTATEVTETEFLAASTSSVALRLAAAVSDTDSVVSAGGGAELRREIHQATGMVLAQLGITATEAFARLQAHSFSSGKSLHFVAREVVSRRLNFGDLE